MCALTGSKRVCLVLPSCQRKKGKFSSQAEQVVIENGNLDAQPHLLPTHDITGERPRETLSNPMDIPREGDISSMLIS